MPCQATFNDTVCVNAEVRVRPEVTVGRVQTFCIGEAEIGECTGRRRPFCSFDVSQEICVQIPLTFGARVRAIPRGIVCGEPEVGPCDVDDNDDDDDDGGVA